jgi:nicotinamide mononucleotide transporter
LRGTAKNGQPLQVQRLPRESRVRALAATLTAWPLLALLLLNTTDTEVPFFDALPTVASITGQLLLGRKYIENWLVWAVVNVISVALFFYKAMWLTAILYAFFAVLSVVGWRAWLRLLQSDSSDAKATAAGRPSRAA